MSENIGSVACNNKEHANNERHICDIATKYREDGTQDYMEPIDHIRLPEMEGDCEVPHRQESILSAPVPLTTGLVEDYIYKELEDMEHVSTDYLYTTGGENQNKYSVLFNYDTMDSLSEWMDEAFFGDDAGKVSGDGERHLCSEFYPYLQPGSILKTVSDAIYNQIRVKRKQEKQSL